MPGCVHTGLACEGQPGGGAFQGKARGRLWATQGHKALRTLTAEVAAAPCPVSHGYVAGKHVLCWCTECFARPLIDFFCSQRTWTWLLGRTDRQWEVRQSDSSAITVVIVMCSDKSLVSPSLHLSSRCFPECLTCSNSQGLADVADGSSDLGPLSQG